MSQITYPVYALVIVHGVEERPTGIRVFDYSSAKVLAELYHYSVFGRVSRTRYRLILIKAGSARAVWPPSVPAFGKNDGSRWPQHPFVRHTFGLATNRPDGDSFTSRDLFVTPQDIEVAKTAALSARRAKEYDTL